MSVRRDYETVRNVPVARFFYQGRSHTHPVRRTVIITEVRPDRFTGYELREGATTRSFKNAPIKSYSKRRIARVDQIDRRRILRKENPESKNTTLARANLLDLVRNGP